MWPHKKKSSNLRTLRNPKSGSTEGERISGGSGNYDPQSLEGEKTLHGYGLESEVGRVWLGPLAEWEFSPKKVHESYKSGLFDCMYRIHIYIYIE